MKTPTFEIRVALLGYVSAGKSTVLNALLQGKYAQVGMRRTTAGVHQFRLHTKPNEEDEDDDDDDTSNVVDDPCEDERDKENIHRSETAGGAFMNESWGSEPESMLDASDTLHKIVRDNSRLRETNQLQESTFDVELDEPLCPMRPDTKMVLIDIPGLNEAGSNDLFRGYVNDKWDTFDCAIAVMDVFQGVNTEEQIQLLELIRDNNVAKKCVPVIVLCNKVDDLDDEELMQLAGEVRKKVDEIFECDSSNISDEGTPTLVLNDDSGMSSIVGIPSTWNVHCFHDAPPLC
jgi:GTPase SAR1 family protein